jgi:hypothetical protein
MSVRAISWVWQNSKQKGGALLLELAIADFADDNGRAWPAIETLAAKARMTTRNANYVIEKKLKPAGLTVKQNAGPYRTNLFQLPIHGGEKISPLKDFQDETHFPETLKPISPNPSLNRHRRVQRAQAKPSPSLHMLPLGGLQKKKESSAAVGLPGFKETVAVYHDLFLTKFGAKPDIDGRDGKLLAGLVRAHGADDVQGLLRFFFEHPPDWVEKKGKFTLYTFKGIYTELLAQSCNSKTQMRAF